jgi:heptosyltransferase-2
MSSFKESVDNPNVKRILAVTIGGMGDAILFSPVLKALALRYPKAEIEILLANTLAHSIYARCKEITHVSLVNINHRSFVKNVFELTRFAIKSRIRKGFDLGVFATSLNFKLSVFLKYVAGIGNIVSAPVPPTYSTDLQCNTALAKCFFENADENDAFVPLTKGSQSEAEEIAKLHGLNFEDKNLLAICPSTEFWHRPRWQLLKLKEIFLRIRNLGFDCRAVIIGTTKEGRQWQSEVGACPGIINLAGKLSILASAYFISRCSLAICNDGGLMHVAGAMGCPTVAVMPNAPRQYKPPGRETIMIRSNLPCSGCYPERPDTCRVARCTDDIAVESVFQACHNLILSLRDQQSVVALS